MQLYISDLDGTLLNSRIELSPETIQIVNRMIQQGMQFTIATARSIYSAAELIAPLKLKLPLIFNNGVFIYDPLKKQNIAANLIPKSVALEIIDLCHQHQVSPIIFTAATSDYEDQSKALYRGIFNYGEEFYIKERLAKGDRRFHLVDDFKPHLTNNLCMLLVIGSKEKLNPLYLKLQSRDLAIHYGEDIYSKAYWLEISHPSGTKKTAAAFLKEYLQADQLICFGDNLNDLPLFEVADIKCAVSNAHDHLKRVATQIIASNNDNGVARFLESYHQQNTG